MRKLLLSFTGCFTLFVTFAQDNALTAKDYQHAESMMGYSTQQYIDRGFVSPNWFGQDKFWYRVLTPQGSEFMVVEAAKGTRTPAFNKQKLATALSSATGRAYSANMLPFQIITYSSDGTSILFRTDGKQWKYDPKKNTLDPDT